MIDRAIYLGSLCQSSNPAYAPITVAADSSYTLHGNTAYSFLVEEDMYITLDIDCLECGNAISIKATDRSPQLELFPAAGLNKDDLLLNHSPLSPNHSPNRPVLPAPLCPEEVERWIAAANQIDLAKIIEKWRK